MVAYTAAIRHHDQRLFLATKPVTVAGAKQLNNSRPWASGGGSIPLSTAIQTRMHPRKPTRPHSIARRKPRSGLDSDVLIEILHLRMPRSALSEPYGPPGRILTA